METKILIIEDDPVLGEVIKEHVKLWKYTPNLVNDGAEGLKQALTNEYSLLIADIALPNLSGLHITQRIRESGINLPIIIITQESTSTNHENAYEFGANIFHPKPINFSLLSVQSKSLIKYQKYEKPVQMGGFMLDYNKRRLSYKDQTIDLTPKELSVIQALAANPGYVLDRNKLINLTFRGVNDTSYGSIDTLISRLRKKISSLSPELDSESLIETAHGVGYKINTTPNDHTTER